MSREICFDTETTGLNPFDGHRLIEIGCVEILDGKITDNNYHILINPEREVPEDAVAIHHITTEMLKDKGKFSEIADGFLDFIKDSTLIAHNAGFDVKFINFELENIGMPKLSNKVVDSLALAQSVFPNQRNSLDALCKRFNIDNTERERKGHGALLDAELLADVYLRLNSGFQERLVIEEKNKEKQAEKYIKIEKLLQQIKNNKIMESRNFTPSDDEIEKHREFLVKYVKNSLWLEEKN